MDEQIPVVDLRNFSGAGSSGHFSRATVQQVAEELCAAFRTWGFAYIKNHGIPAEKVKDAMTLSKELFELPESKKAKLTRRNDTDYHGWVGLEVENLNPDERAEDYKELFDAVDFDGERWPDQDVPDIRKTMNDLNGACQTLSLDILYLMAVGLHMQDENVFVNCHRFGQYSTATALRTLYYPRPVNGYKDDQISCGEHSDYGSITLLFQDDIGGLQVFDQSKGRYVDAVPMDGTVIVNIGDLCGGRRMNSSPRHRVVMPVAANYQTKPRQSLAFFVLPEDNKLIECVDGSGKYEPITARDYLLMRFAATQRISD